MQSIRHVIGFLLTGVAVLAAGAAQGQPSNKLLAVNRVRFFPARGHEKAMLGGRICGSNTSPESGFEVLARIESVPAAGRWTELTFPNSKPYRWIKYDAPAGSRG